MVRCSPRRMRCNVIRGQCSIRLGQLRGRAHRNTSELTLAVWFTYEMMALLVVSRRIFRQDDTASLPVEPAPTRLAHLVSQQMRSVT